MSATNRGTVRDPKDFYPTDRKAVYPLLPHLPRGVEFWEPCAGDGRIIRMLRESGRIAGGADLYPQDAGFGAYTTDVGIDYLKDTTPREFVLTNPPFSVAFEMCQHALTHSAEFMFLLRLSFLESDGRGDWLAAHEPAGLWVLRKRPSFVMSVTCKSVPLENRWQGKIGDDSMPRLCKHNWLVPIESERPKTCPKCGGTNLAISTSDNSGYAWMYWGPRAELSGIHHI